MFRCATITIVEHLWYAIWQERWRASPSRRRFRIVSGHWLMYSVAASVTASANLSCCPFFGVCINVREGTKKMITVSQCIHRRWRHCHCHCSLRIYTHSSRIHWTAQHRMNGFSIFAFSDSICICRYGLFGLASMVDAGVRCTNRTIFKFWNIN